jgi:hypothetical protein
VTAADIDCQALKELFELARLERPVAIFKQPSA